MKTSSTLRLLLLMIVVPQIVETIYSPVLPSIAISFLVSTSQAAQTLSIYFSAFAFGVATWGVIADRCGRRSAMLAGILIYAFATAMAMVTDNFTILMCARAMSAFGIAVGSVVTQTMLRDIYSGVELASVFSLVSMGVAVSPIIGMLLGGQLAELGGYRSVFAALSLSAFFLFALNMMKLPETRSGGRFTPNLMVLAKRLYTDTHVWQSALLIALYNIALFSYYQLGGFTFDRLGLSVEEFAYSGILLGVGSLLGSYLNKGLLKRKYAQSWLLWFANTLFLLGAVGVFLLNNSIYFLFPMLLIVMAFGIAIPNVISGALQNYQESLGSAGALLGLQYYLIIGGGLALAGVVQNLGVVLLGLATAISLVMLSRGIRSLNKNLSE